MAPPAWIRALAQWGRQRPGRALVVGSLVVLGLVWLLQPAPPSPSSSSGKETPVALPPVVPPQVPLEKALAELQRDNEHMRQALQTQQQALDHLRRTQANHLQSQQQVLSEQRRMLEAAVQQVQRQVASPPPPPAPPPVAPATTRPKRVPPVPVPASVPPVPRLRILRPAEGNSVALAAVSTAEPVSRAEAYLPAGSFVHAKLLTGLFATTQAGGALPALFAIQEAFVGPNRHRIPLQGCLALGKAQANLNALRAIVQLTTLSCVLPDGRTLEKPLVGYATGLDGTLGLPGRLEHREGAFLARTFLASLISGAASAFASAESTTQVTPLGGAQTVVTGDTGKFAAFSALSGATARLAEFYVGQLHQLLPMVWVESGTNGYLVLQEGMPLPGVAGTAQRASDLD